MENKGVFIGSRIRTAREAAGLSQLQLAKELDFETSTAVSLIESGDRKVTAENLERIAAILHKDISFFLDAEERKTTDVKVALRADKDLSKADQNAILRFIDLAKQNRNGKRRT